ncbi:MAG TPA: C1 family peptidase [Candidatus Egerieousia sp.]|nr:C1 family peptidase [Candidatus Egerieousia sp.]HPT05622.1 C1 family peptidase [Candidatus Egerieousia sp.]
MKINIKHIAITALCVTLAYSAVNAQSIGNKEIEELQGSIKNDSYTAAIQNILTSNKNIKSLALNHKVNGATDNFFKYKVDVKGITDQQSSGRCWMFSSMNDLRPAVIKKYNLDEFDFSHNYNYFWDILEKSNLFLENIIKTVKTPMDDREVTYYFSSPVSDGGVWSSFYNLAKKYGVVPASVMPETEQSDNTSQMMSILNERLRKGGYDIRAIAANKGKTADIEREKMSILKDVYRVLAICLGEPPTEFTWRFQDKDKKIQTIKSTPIDFFNGIVGTDYNTDTYVMIMNDPTRDYYKMYEIENARNIMDGINWTYLNLPNEDIKKAVLASIKANESVVASCDVGKQSNTKNGLLDTGIYDYASLLGINLNMDKKARIVTRQSGSSHAMLIVACDTDNNDIPTKWEFENSWGTDAGNKGYLTFTDNWFNEYMFRFVINKKYLDGKTIGCLGQKHIMLPPWDYMN